MPSLWKILATELPLGVARPEKAGRKELRMLKFPNPSNIRRRRPNTQTRRSPWIAMVGKPKKMAMDNDETSKERQSMRTSFEAES
jgi:hypothetical protein